MENVVYLLFFPKECKQPSQLVNEKSVVASCEREEEEEKERGTQQRRDRCKCLTWSGVEERTKQEEGKQKGGHQRVIMHLVLHDVRAETHPGNPG
jgi:hypothetical protein